MSSFYISACALLAVFFAAGIVLGSKGEKKDYSLGGRKAGAAGVTGILLGSLVGGASTVGTVQMAYSYGMTAWWFALGGGIGCLLLGLRFAVPLRRSRITTIADYLGRSYGGGRFGRGIALAATAASSLGTFISICAQFLSCIALLRGVLPLSAPAAALVSALSIWGFVAFGGMKSFAKLGEGQDSAALRHARRLRRRRARLGRDFGDEAESYLPAVVQSIRPRLRAGDWIPRLNDSRSVHDADLHTVLRRGEEPPRGAARRVRLALLMPPMDCSARRSASQSARAA